MIKVYGQIDKTVFDKVWKFVKEKTSGQRITVAQWIRKFVQTHPEYKQDSVITNEIGFDLLAAVTAISDQKIIDPNFQPFM